MDNVKARLIELVPDILELKFGFRFEEKPAFGSSLRNDTYQGEKIFIVLMPTTDGKKWIVMTDGGFQHVPTDQIEAWHIPVGRPITLADVLRAIDIHKGKTPDHVVMEIGYLPSGMWMFFRGGTHAWNLTTDYDNQTQEMKDFIGKLLGV